MSEKPKRSRVKKKPDDGIPAGVSAEQREIMESYRTPEMKEAIDDLESRMNAADKRLESVRDKVASLDEFAELPSNAKSKEYEQAADDLIAKASKGAKKGAGKLSDDEIDDLNSKAADLYEKATEERIKQNGFNLKSHYAVKGGDAAAVNAESPSKGSPFEDYILKPEGLAAPSDQVKSVSAEAASFFDGVLSKEHHGDVTIHVAEIPGANRQRAFSEANGYDGQPLVALNPDSGVKVAVHEIAHGLEKGETLRMTKAFLAKRCKNEVPSKMDWLEDDYGEWGSKDDFTKAFSGSDYAEKKAYYAGKHYPDATEILSLGCEMLFENPIAFAKDDPEYFKFVVGVLNGDLLGG